MSDLPEAPQIDAATLQRMLEQERSARVEMCNVGIAEVLKRHHCGLVPVVVIRGGQIASEIQIVAE